MTSRVLSFTLKGVNLSARVTEWEENGEHHFDVLEVIIHSTTEEHKKFLIDVLMGSSTFQDFTDEFEERCNKFVKGK